MERLTFEGMFCDIARCTGDECAGACSQKETWERLKSIEDILGVEYDLDRLWELVEADRDGRCVIYLKGFPVASTYLQEGGLYIRETSGVIGHEEYKAALKGEQDGQ